MSYIKGVLSRAKQAHPKLFENGGDLFCVGFSRGGRLCSHLPSQLAESEYRFRAIAPIASVQFPGYDGSTPPTAVSPPAYKLGVIAVHQTEDSTNHYSRGFGGYEGCADCTVSKAISNWEAHNGCQKSSSSVLDASAWGGLPTAREDHTECTQGADVTLVRLDGKILTPTPAGHNYPVAGSGTSITTKTVWAFFDAHRSLN
jgi:poly(3-hydroxybutyrate) depolymerase